MVSNWIHKRPIVLILSTLMLVLLSGCKFQWGHIGYNTGYQPDQPIPFSHELHAGKYKMDCLYCHSNVEKSKHSSVPSLNVCMNCHRIVKADSPHIQKLQAAYDEGGTINWVKVHMLPDHVKFNHKRHVKFLANSENRAQACQTCHGQINQMEVVHQESSLSMGWCINCHRDPTEFIPTELQKNYTEAGSPKGKLNCTTCHH